MSESRQRPPFKGPRWIITLVALVTLVVITALIYPPRNSVTCYMFSGPGCQLYQQFLFVPSRELTDTEAAAQVVTNEIMNLPESKTANPKIAFMFLTPGALPFEPLWEMFLRVRDSPHPLPRFEPLWVHSFLFHFRVMRTSFLFMCTRQRRVLRTQATTLLVEIFTVTRWIFQLVSCKKF